jgi:hypothetical protein
MVLVENGHKLALNFEKFPQFCVGGKNMKFSSLQKFLLVFFLSFMVSLYDSGEFFALAKNFFSPTSRPFVNLNAPRIDYQDEPKICDNHNGQEVNTCPDQPVIKRKPSVPTTPTSHYQIMGNDGGIVKDTQTGLMWMRCSIGQTWNGSTCTGEAQRMNWHDAMAFRTSYGGYSDWRLPRKSELESLVYCSDGNYASLGSKEYGYICTSVVKQLLTIDITYFPNTPKYHCWFWSSSYNDKSNVALLVDFNFGESSGTLKYNELFVRLVKANPH